MGDRLDRRATTALHRITPQRRGVPDSVLELRRGQAGERRAKDRFDTAEPVPVRIMVPSAQMAMDGETVNMSETGCFIVSARPLPLGTAIDLEVQLADAGLLLHAQGIVVRQGENRGRFGMGIEFASVSYGAQVLVELLRAEIDDRAA